MNLHSEVGRRVALNRLYRKYGEDVAFQHMLGRASGVVPGNGPTFAPLMFVGEAPGANEDKKRIPFIGASGQFLNEMLESVGLHREDVFVTNTVKIRPTDEGRRNRTPSEQEIRCSIPYLREEHSLLGRPPLVVLGRPALKAAMMLDRSLLSMPLKPPHGQWAWIGEYLVLPLYHPAYGLYQHKNKPIMFEQFKAVLKPPKGPL